jgi:hypothetical protein
MKGIDICHKETSVAVKIRNSTEKFRTTLGLRQECGVSPYCLIYTLYLDQTVKQWVEVKQKRDNDGTK